jgi:hypothetical protein
MEPSILAKKKVYQYHATFAEEILCVLSFVVFTRIWGMPL